MLAICISLPHRHSGNSVQPGTSKRSNADIGYLRLALPLCIAWPVVPEPTVRGTISLEFGHYPVPDRTIPRERSLTGYKMQEGKHHRLDGMNVLAVQMEIVEGRQSDQSYR